MVIVLKKIIDSHIHLDQYKEEEIERIIEDLNDSQCSALISVSTHLHSCRANLALAQKHKEVKPAFGFHPEQALPLDSEIATLLSWIEKHKEHMIAIGEVGLPYYLHKETKTPEQFPFEGYVELLEQFLIRASAWNKPAVLHAVYDDAPVVIELLEKHSIQQAHFHWFKGDSRTTQRMIGNGYMISITPDVLYEKEIQTLVRQYPLEQMMVETDGPWPFKGQFTNQMTHPKMIHASVSKIAELKKAALLEVYEKLYRNTAAFYRLDI